ncbi:MAG: alpha/beta hydrolase [Actinomycetota bacterium]
MSDTASVFAVDDVTILTSTDGEPIALHDFGGDGPGPPLLLSHGNGLNAGMWAAALPALRERYRCFGLDLRGHGRCRPVDPDYSIDSARFADDIRCAIEAIGGPVRYAAHSLGAASAVTAAMTDTSPFVGLWLFEPVLLPTGFERNGDGPGPLIDISRRRRMNFDSVDDAFERFVSKPPFAGCDPTAVRGYVELGTRPIDEGVRLSCRGVDEARVFESVVPFDFAALGAIDRPTVLASGAAANTLNALPPVLAPLVAEAIPGAVWEEHQGLSHFGPMERPDLMVESITALFDRIDDDPHLASDA